MPASPVSFNVPADCVRRESTYVLVVDNRDDGRDLAGIQAISDEDDAADFDAAPGRTDDCCFTHLGGDLTLC